jgi:DNA mismatch repair ATPase MutS
MEETGDIVKEATKSSIVLLDELGRGTSTFDGVSIAYGVLRYIVEKIQCLTLFSTHYHMLVDEFKLYDNVENYCMDFEFIDDEENNKKINGHAIKENQRRINFKYKFVKGFSEKSFGINVAKLASLPDSIIDMAR